jgi:signal transduction histidine kinase
MDRKAKTVLYVDDEVQNLQGFKISFYDEYNVFTAQSVKEAYEILSQNEIKVIISDQRMPEISGLEFLANVKEKYTDIVRIILTAYADADTLIKAVNQGGVYRYLLKPWNELELRITINNALERYQLRKENENLLNDLQNKNAELTNTNEELRATTVALKEREIRLKEQNEEYLSLNEELTQTVEELAVAKERAEESDQLKTSFLQNMSHEIRTPMNAIIGFANMLKDPDVDNQAQKEYVDIIINSGAQLLSIVDDVLTISAIDTKQTKMHLTCFSVTDMLRELHLQFSQFAAQKSLQVIYVPKIDPACANIVTDKTKLTQIISNLLTNAIKYTSTGYVEFGADVADNKFKIYIKDTGIGIKPEYHKIIFERFRQVAASHSGPYGGTGLGLAISKALIEMLGGSIGVESEPGIGSVFNFEIPVQIIRPEASGEGKSLNVKHEMAINVLVAEDEYYNFLLIKKMLQNISANVYYARNGQEAIDLIKKEQSIDLILMDIKMPLVDGVEAARQIREIRNDVPIIAQTAYAAQGDRERFLNGDFNGYVSKPINIHELYSLIDKYIS